MKKSTVIALVVFVGLVVVVIMSTQNVTERGITRITFADVDAKTIDRIVITGKNPVELKLDGEKWLLSDNRLADDSAVKRLNESIPKIVSSDLVTKDSKRFAELEVDPEKGSQVSAFSKGQKVAEFVIGKSASGGVYVKKGDEVYAVKQVYPYVFSKKASDWYKLKLFDQKIEDITRVEMNLQQQKPYALLPKEDKWELADPLVAPVGFRFDSSGARSLVSSLVNLRAKEIVLQKPEDSQTGLKEGFDTLAFTDKANQRTEIHLGKVTDKEDVYLQVVGNEDIYLLPKYTVQSLRKTVSDLRDMKMVELDATKVTKLSILDGKSSLEFEKQGTEWKIARSSEKIPSDFELDDQAIQRRISALANARATKIADAKLAKESGLQKPQTLVQATLEGGSLVKMVFGKQTKLEDKELVFAKGNIDNETYLVANWTRTNLTGGLSTFKKRPMPEGPQGMPMMDPQAMSNLPPEVRAQLMQQMQQEQQKQMMMQQIQAQMKEKEKEKEKDKKPTENPPAKK